MTSSRAEVETSRQGRPRASCGVPLSADLRVFAGLAILAAGVPLLWWIGNLPFGGVNFNDYHDYWLAGKLILEGRSPYDIQALAELARTEGQTFILGGGYQYLLPWAVAMLPFSLIPFTASVLLFNALSLAAFGVTVAAWLRFAHGYAPVLRRRLAIVALLAGLYPPITGTIVNGQANLVVLAALALGTACVVWGGTAAVRALGGVAVGLATVVKLVPAVLALPILLGRRFGVVAALAAAVVLPVIGAALLLPFASGGSGGLGSLFETDAYFTNQSVNGFITRLVQDTDRTAAIVPGAFDPFWPMLALTALFAVATAAFLWRARERVTPPRGLALGMAFALVAGLAGAPKASFWTDVLALVAAGLLLAFETPDLDLSRLGRLDRALLLFWYGASLVQAVLWDAPPPASLGGPILTLAESAGFYGLLALWILLVRRLAAEPARAFEEAAGRAVRASEPARKSPPAPAQESAPKPAEKSPRSGVV